jgi:hypothetical protein
MNPLVDALKRRKEAPQEQEMEMPEPSRMLSVSPQEVMGVRPGDPVTLTVQGIMGDNGTVSVQTVAMEQEEAQEPISVTTQESHS